MTVTAEEIPAEQIYELFISLTVAEIVFVIFFLKGEILVGVSGSKVSSAKEAMKSLKWTKENK